MGKEETAILKGILEELRYLRPPVTKVQVEPPDPAMSFYLLDLDQVCYVTTRTPDKPLKPGEKKEEDLMFVTSTGDRYFSGIGLLDLENKLKEHPHFMRTAKAYLVNLTKVRGFKFSSSRDLWFEGLAEPVKNAVTSSYKDDFDIALGIKVDGAEEENS